LARQLPVNIGSAIEFNTYLKLKITTDWINKITNEFYCFQVSLKSFC